MEINIQNVSMTYPSGKQALQNLSLELRSPSLIGLLGPNGAGKSTLMKLLVAALKGLRDSGTAVREVIRTVNLEGQARARIRSLSGGQRQRVGIAQALLGAPPLLILDEPTVGLDPEERIHFRNLFSRTAQDRLVLLSTHIIEDVQSVCDQIVVIHHGQIRFTGTPEQLIASAAGHVGVFWEKDETQEQGLHITARVNTSQGVRCRAVADQLPPYVQAEEPTLEDAYLYLISREAAQ